MIGAFKFRRLPELLTSIGLVVFTCLAASHACANQDPYGAISAMFDSQTYKNAPKVISSQDERLYRQIFRAQSRGDWATADKLFAKVDNQLLHGHILFDRYLHAAYTSKYSELRDWLTQYGDHPEGYRIHKLALRKKGNAAAPPKAEKRRYRTDPHFILVPAFDTRKFSNAHNRRIAEINRKAKSLLARERPTQTLNYISEASVRKDLTDAEFARIKSWIAAQYFFERVPDKALSIAQEVTAKNRADLPLADWIAGLSAWRLGQYETAAQHFEAYSQAQYATDQQKAAGAYWAARTQLVLKNPRRVNPLLERAARYKYTFYGVLANRQLGNRHAYNWTEPKISDLTVRQLAEQEPAAARAIALAQIGQIEKAEMEIVRAHGKLSKSHDKALAAVAFAYDLPRAQLLIGEYTMADDIDVARYPVPLKYKPTGGFKVDRALVYAFMRKESKFDPNARSWAGARGLMQLMPKTASYIAKDSSLAADNRNKLYDPEYNLSLGQKYLQQLMGLGTPEGNLFMLTGAYNGGPTNLRRWKNELTTDSANDPLFFIESLPSRETRDFIEEVLTNFWIYRDRLDQKTPSLDLAAAGKWPVYKQQDTLGLGKLAQKY